MPRSGVAEEPFPSPSVGDLRVPACLLLARIDGRSPTSTDQWLLSSAVHYDRSWPTAAIPHVRPKRPLDKSGSCWERQLTGLVANSHFRPKSGRTPTRVTE